MSEVFNSSVLDAINRAVQDGISTTALEVDGTPQYCIINAETREIEIPGELNIFGVESDEKSTRVYFRCPKYVGTNVDLDMTRCMVYVPYRNANGEKDQYIVTDLNETEDGENVEFTWLISRKASAYMGITEFGIRAIKTAVGGTIEAEWNTTVASANVIRGMDVGLLEFSEENKDALAQALDLINQELEQTKNEMNSDIETKGQQTLASIPDDYTQLHADVDGVEGDIENTKIKLGFTFTNQNVGKWSQGSINYKTGYLTSNESLTEARTNNAVQNIENVGCNLEFCFSVFAYSDSTYDNFIGVLNENGEYSKNEESLPVLTENTKLNPNYYYRFVVKYKNGSEFDNYEINPLYTIIENTTLHEDVENLKKQINKKITFDESFLTRASIEVYKDSHGYFTTFDIKDFIIKDNEKKTYYISTDGNDENNGLLPDKPLKLLSTALSKEDCLTVICLEGTYTHDNGIVNTVIDNKNIIGIGNCIFDFGSAESVQVKGNAYIENITFKGGWQNFNATLLDNNMLYINKCNFVECKAFNSISILGGTVFLYRCFCKGSYYDGFNYHNNGSSIPNVVEIECSSELTGAPSVYENENGNSCNGSTIHNNARIIRLNCDYKISHGGVIADKTGMSYNIGCIASYSTITNDVDDRFKANYWFEGETKSWIIGCKSFGSKYDISAALGAIVYTDNMFSNNYKDEQSNIILIN